MLSVVWLALRSLVLTVRGQASWKGRTLAIGTRRLEEYEHGYLDGSWESK
jgi:hypothetical protein